MDQKNDTLYVSDLIVSGFALPDSASVAGACEWTYLRLVCQRSSLAP